MIKIEKEGGGNTLHDRLNEAFMGAKSFQYCFNKAPFDPIHRYSRALSTTISEGAVSVMLP